MPLKVVHDSIEEIPESYRDLYTERDGKLHLTGISGVKTEKDIQTLRSSLDAARGDVKKVADKLTAWESLGESPEEVQKILDKVPELEAAAEGKLDEDKINEIAERRAESLAAPHRREAEKLKNQISEVSKERDELSQQAKLREVHDSVRSAMSEAKVVGSAQDDVLLLSERLFEKDESGNVVTKENVGVTPGLSPKEWLEDVKPKKPHWWPASIGGGADGSGGGGVGDNPWSKKNWSLTKQGEYLRENGVEAAERAAKAAGSYIGATQPAEG